MFKSHATGTIIYFSKFSPTFCSLIAFDHLIRHFFFQIIRFAMDSTLNIQKLKSGGVYLPGAGHVDDLYYIFP